MKKIAIFASGSGSNAENLITRFASNRDMRVVSVFCNKQDAFVITRAKNLGIPSIVFAKKELLETDNILNELQSQGIDYIILAGFLLKIPENLLLKYSDKIINIHPALLPNYGGKGMYGDNVHKAVIAAKEKESGITIHLVNEKYDDGKTLFQARCTISKDDTPESLAQKIHNLEHRFFPEVVEKYILEKEMEAV